MVLDLDSDFAKLAVPLIVEIRMVMDVLLSVDPVRRW
jgi:hypothetical protein